MGIRRLGRLIGRLLLLGLTLWAITLGGVVAVSLFWPRDEALPAPADAIICLGAGLSKSDPSLPGPASDRRAGTCAALYAAGVAPVVVFSGYGRPGHSVADAMANRAIALGLPPEAALREPDSQSTIQNAAYSLLLLPADTDRVILVSDPFHLPRAWVIFRLMGVEDVALHASARPRDPASAQDTYRRWILRESVAIWYNIARGVTYGVGGLVGIDRDTRIGWFN